MYWVEWFFQVDENSGRATGETKAYAICGAIRRMVSNSLIVPSTRWVWALPVWPCERDVHQRKRPNEGKRAVINCRPFPGIGAGVVRDLSNVMRYLVPIFIELFWLTLFIMFMNSVHVTCFNRNPKCQHAEYWFMVPMTAYARTRLLESRLMFDPFQIWSRTHNLPM